MSDRSNPDSHTEHLPKIGFSTEESKERIPIVADLATEVLWLYFTAAQEDSRTVTGTNDKQSKKYELRNAFFQKDILIDNYEIGLANARSSGLFGAETAFNIAFYYLHSAATIPTRIEFIQGKFDNSIANQSKNTKILYILEDDKYYDKDNDYYTDLKNYWCEFPEARRHTIPPDIYLATFRPFRATGSTIKQVFDLKVSGMENVIIGGQVGGIKKLDRAHPFSVRGKIECDGNIVVMPTGEVGSVPDDNLSIKTNGDVLMLGGEYHATETKCHNFVHINGAVNPLNIALHTRLQINCTGGSFYGNRPDATTVCIQDDQYPTVESEYDIVAFRNIMFPGTTNPPINEVEEVEETVPSLDVLYKEYLAKSGESATHKARRYQFTYDPNDPTTHDLINNFKYNALLEGWEIDDTRLPLNEGKLLISIILLKKK